ncbi:MAG: sigma-70 family RNA polymerase sigma factor [Verrucomicrobia bacterium]|nr:sigma-70 family RNA polymerase sigma factor [Verrucomicrobiota bacterium]
MSDTDLKLLKRYTHDSAEDAFAEIVRRHVDLVHSAALRQVRSLQLAEEVAQSAFTDLARNAAKLIDTTRSTHVLTAWLYQVTRRTAIDVVRREARRQLREQIATEMNAMNATTEDWTHIEPILDEAMHELDETDRAAILLRYFKNHDLRTVGATLGISDDAAQKRVSRAVERLREFFAKRGVTVGAGGLAGVISANAVQAAPVGLALAISTASALTGTTLATTATVTATKAIAMTALQKTIVTATIAALAGAGIYEARQASQLRGQVERLQQTRAPFDEAIKRLEKERDELTNRLASIQEDNERLNRNTSELLALRSEITLARKRFAEPLIAQIDTVSSDTKSVETNGVAILQQKLREQRARIKLTEEKVDKMLKSLNVTYEITTNIFYLADQGGEVNETFRPVLEVVQQLFEERRFAILLERKIAFEMLNASLPASTTNK